MKKPDETCVFCLITGRYVSWALLIFGGVVGGLATFGFPHPSPIIERLATYGMALALLMFLIVGILDKITERSYCSHRHHLR